MRDSILDIVKGIGIILVVVGHLPLGLGGIIYQFHMPLFFLISGLCFKEKYYSHKTIFVLKRIQSLIIPYVVLTILAFFLWPHDSCSWKQMFSIHYDYNILGTFWFLRDLFKTSILCFITGYIISIMNLNRIILPVFFLLVAHVLNIIGKDGLSHIFYISFFYSFGSFMRQYKEKFYENIKGRYYFLLMFILPWILSIEDYHIITTTDYKSFVTYAIGAMFGIIATFELGVITKNIDKFANLFSDIGQYTLAIMLFHMLCFALVDMASQVINLSPIGGALIKLIVGVFMPILINKIYNYVKKRCIYYLR